MQEDSNVSLFCVGFVRFLKSGKHNFICEETKKLSAVATNNGEAPLSSGFQRLRKGLDFGGQNEVII